MISLKKKAKHLNKKLLVKNYILMIFLKHLIKRNLKVSVDGLLRSISYFECDCFNISLNNFWFNFIYFKNLRLVLYILDLILLIE
jgi:hypothetical protein